MFETQISKFYLKSKKKKFDLICKKSSSKWCKSRKI